MNPIEILDKAQLIVQERPGEGSLIEYQLGSTEPLFCSLGACVEAKGENWNALVEEINEQIYDPELGRSISDPEEIEPEQYKYIFTDDNLNSAVFYLAWACSEIDGREFDGKDDELNRKIVFLYHDTSTAEEISMAFELAKEKARSEQ